MRSARLRDGTEYAFAIQIDRSAPSNTLDANTEMLPDFTRLRLISETPSVKLCCARDAVGLVIDCIHDHLSTHSAFEGTDISRLNNSSDIGERTRLFRSGG